MTTTREGAIINHIKKSDITWLNKASSKADCEDSLKLAANRIYFIAECCRGFESHRNLKKFRSSAGRAHKKSGDIAEKDADSYCHLLQI